MREKKS
jgi:hypothetical protein